MISRNYHNHLIKVQNFSLEENQTVNRILLFIRDTLPEFENIFRNSSITISLEDDISKELLRFFGDKARSENLFFQFNEKKGVDFTIYVTPFKMGVSSIFMIEAKRLSKDKYDYVSNRNGGIERFKREQDEFGKHLNCGAMIGYIQNENRSYWENRINTWIDDLIIKNTDIEWTLTDKLSATNKLSDYTSQHNRITKTPITLFHYWISLN